MNGSMNWGEARRRMVDGQVRPNRVTDPRILLAMREIPRELFAPPAMRVRALAAEDLALGGGRVMLQPMTIARMIQVAAPRSGERVLVAASGTGYGAALLAHMGAEVTALEDDPALLALAGPAIAASALPPGTLRQEVGPPAAGLPGAARFDLILVEGAVPSVPPALVAQLPEGGRLLAIRRGPGESGVVVLGRRIGAGFSAAEVFGVRGVLLPAFAARPGFALV